MKLVTASTMREMDRRTIEEFHIPGIILMENAALRVVEAIVERYGPLQGKHVVVLCGKGNNGGDGFAIARHLGLRFGARVDVFTPFDPELVSGDGDASQNLTMAKSCASLGYFGPFEETSDYSYLTQSVGYACLVIDALFGTGIKGAITGDAARMIETVNDMKDRRRPQDIGDLQGRPPTAVDQVHNPGPYIVAVDIPSGVDADTGAVNGPAIEADLTVTFGLAKPGLICYPGASNAGDLVVGDIGMPRPVIDEAPAAAYVTEAVDVAQWLPRRENGRDTNKGKFGHVLVLAGSRGFMGAANMASHAAARAGAGLVTLAVPESLLPAAMSAASPVIMTKGLPETKQGTFAKAALEIALKLCEKATAVAIGPGIGAEVDETADFVREFVKQCPVPIVVDADALTVLAGEQDHGQSIVASRTAATVLTPHPGEMGRLIGKSTADVQDGRFDVARDVSKRYRATVLLKGARTLIATDGHAVNINVTGNPGMATGGAGDVLTGIIAAFVGMKLDAHAAASAGAYVHGLAGDIAAERNGGPAGLIATDLIGHLPAALGRCG